MSMISKIVSSIKNPKKAIVHIKDKIITIYRIRKFKNLTEEIVVGVNIAIWKRSIIEQYYPDKKILFIPDKFSKKKLLKLYNQNKNLIFLIWGYGESEVINNFINENKFRIMRIEDGFIRSIGLGASHTIPLSLVVDREELYFSKKNNRLRDILNNYDFKSNDEILERAKKNIDFIISNNISKYNFKESDLKPFLLPKKLKKRILVIGQVESDASIIHGMDKMMTNNELVKLAYEENPNAEIYYKPHPDVLLGYRKKVSDEKEVENISMIIRENVSLTKLFIQEIDHVYTMTSLSGFEALMRRIEVTVVGKPFYAGWGLTNDKSTMEDRTRVLTIEELFVGAYILYPDYFSDKTFEKIEIEDVLKIIKNRLCY